MQSHNVKLFLDHWVSNDLIKLILGCKSSEMRGVLHMKPNLGPIKGQSVFWREMYDPQFL